MFKFALPPRANGQPARTFRVMTMIGRVSGLWPRDLNQPALPPFADDVITWVSPSNVITTTRLTGIVDRTPVPERTGCTRFGGAPPNFVCLQYGTVVPYRALRTASLSFSGFTSSSYASAATLALAPNLIGSSFRAQAQSWTTSEGTLP